MKILIIADGFFPGKKYGGPPVSVDNFCSLMTDYECYVLARNHDLGEQTPYADIQEGWNARGNCKVRYLSDGEFNSESFEAIINELEPDWIYLQSLFQRCVLPCLRLSKKLGIRVMLAPRGELCRGAFRKKYKKLPYIMVLRMLGLLKNTEFQSTSQEESEAISRWLIAKPERIHLLSNVPSIPNCQLRQRNKVAGQARLVFLSRIHPKKNLLGAINYLSGVAGEITFDIYGPIEVEEYWRECENAIAHLSDNIEVRYCGMVDHESVHRIFSQYDAFFFPTFSENYGHVIVEAMMVGCPVIISDCSPWTDVEAYNAGWAIPLDDKVRFQEAIGQVVAWDTVPVEATKNYISGKLDLKRLSQEYHSVFGE